jgi:hypothetical protein
MFPHEIAVAPLKSASSELVKAFVKFALKQYASWLDEKKIKILSSKIAELDEVYTLSSPDDTKKLTLLYYPLRISFMDFRRETITPDSLRYFPRGENYIIVGSIGQGKSFLLKYLCLGELSVNSSGRIPVFIELKSIRAGKTFAKVVGNKMKSYGFEDRPLKSFEHLANKGKLVLLLDGFDEIDGSEIFNAYEAIEACVRRYNNLQIILTARPGSEILKSALFKKIKIADILESEIEDFLFKIELRKNDIDVIVSIVRNAPVEIRSVLVTPLLITLFANVYKRCHIGPSSLAQFYDKIFFTFFIGHDKIKPLVEREYMSGLDDVDLEYLFHAFCFYALSLGYGIALSSQEFKEAFTLAKERLRSDCCARGFKCDIINITNLMYQAEDQTCFSHASIQEYYASRYIAKFSEERSKAAYEFIKKPQDNKARWRQVLIFLKQIDKIKYLKYYFINELESILNEFAALNNFDLNSAKFYLWFNLKESYVYFKRTDDGTVRVLGISLQDNAFNRVNNFLDNEFVETLKKEEGLWADVDGRHSFNGSYEGLPCVRTVLSDALGMGGRAMLAQRLVSSLGGLRTNLMNCIKTVEIYEKGRVKEPKRLSDL